jgi:uncharacterized membrane protein YoaK (UPF0700 family)
MGTDGEKKLREWLKAFGCENACDVLVDAGFDSLGMLSSLDEDELQMLEISLKDLPPIKQRRIMRKAEELAGGDIAIEVASTDSIMDARPPRIAQVTAKTDDMKTLVPMVDNDSDKSLNRDSSRQSTVSTAASTASSIADGSSARFATKEGVMQNTSLRVNNFLSNPPERGSDSQWADTKPPTRKVSQPKRIDEVHPLFKIAIIGGVLCLNSGWVNGVAFRSYDGGVTHITGTSSLIGVNFAKQKYSYMLAKATKVFAFIFGSMISGGYLGRKRLFKGGPRHANLLLLVSALIFAACGAEKSQRNFLAAQLLTTGSGVLNALTCLYTGAVLKTATVTSTAMDIGIELGMILFQNDRSGAWKLKLFVTFLFAYVAGGFLGALCFDPSAISGPDFVGADAQALLVPATVLGALAIAWIASLCVVAPDPRGCGLNTEVITLLRDADDTSLEDPPALDAFPPLPARSTSRNSLYARGYGAP